MKAKIYTKTGDNGKTSLVGGARVDKTDPRLDAFGSVDELNSCLGIVISQLDSRLTSYRDLLTQIQNLLFNLGSRLACEDPDTLTHLPVIDDEHVEQLERKIDAWESTLPELKHFILPGGSLASAHLHLARTICRRAERSAFAVIGVEPVVLRYLNRLSDFLFTLARQLNSEMKVSDVAWTK